MNIRFTPPRQQPSVDHGLNVHYAPAKRQAYRLRWYLILLLVASPLLYFLWHTAQLFWQHEAPGYVDIPSYTLASPQSGVVASVTARPGSLVRAGSVLLTLSNPAREAQIRLLQSQITAVKSAPQPATPAVSPAYVRYLQDSLANYQTLFRAGAATRAELDEAVAKLAAVQPARPAGLGVPDTRVLQRDLDSLLAQQAGMQLRAPFDGLVSQFSLLPGMPVREGEPLLQLQQSNQLQIIALLPERFAHQARPGQAVEVRWPDGNRSPALIRHNVQRSDAVPPTLSEFGEAQQGIVVGLQPSLPVPTHYRVRQLRVKIVLPHQWPWQSN